MEMVLLWRKTIFSSNIGQIRDFLIKKVLNVKSIVLVLMTKILARQQRMEGSANVVNVIYITIGYVWTSLVLVMYIDSKESVWMAVEPKAFSVQFLLHFKMSCFRKIRMSCIITFLCLHNFYFAAKNIEVEMFYFYFVIFIFTSVSCNSCLAVFK